MSVITSTPEKFSPLFRDILYRITSDNLSQSETVDIIDTSTNRKIGEKRLKGKSSYNINVAAYFRVKADLEPLNFRESCILSPESRVVFSSIGLGDSRISVPHTKGIVSCKEAGAMSDASTERTIGKNQQEEISIISDKELSFKIIVKKEDGTTKECFSSVSGNVGETLSVIVVNSSHIEALLGGLGDTLDNYVEILVPIYKSGELYSTITYKLDSCEYSTTRLCWWNKYGAVDYFNFSKSSQEIFTVNKERIFTQEGMKVLKKGCEKCFVVASPATTKERAEWLAGIISSPKVWLVCDETYIPIDVVSDKIVTVDEKLSYMEISFKIVDYNI